MMECGEPCGLDSVNLTFFWGVLPLSVWIATTAIGVGFHAQTPLRINC